MNEHTHELLNTTYTTDSLQRKVVLLGAFFDIYFYTAHEETPLKEKLKRFLLEENVGEYLRSNLLSLSDTFYNSFSQDNFQKQLEACKLEQQNRPHITIYVPTILPPIEVEKLGKWARENIAPGIFINLEVDQKVIGGCAFVWNGVYHDYSLYYFMAQKKNEIAALLK